MKGISVEAVASVTVLVGSSGPAVTLLTATPAGKMTGSSEEVACVGTTGVGSTAVSLDDVATERSDKDFIKTGGLVFSGTVVSWVSDPLVVSVGAFIGNITIAILGAAGTEEVSTTLPLVIDSDVAVPDKVVDVFVPLEVLSWLSCHSVVAKVSCLTSFVLDNVRPFVVVDLIRIAWVPVTGASAFSETLMVLDDRLASPLTVMIGE